MGLEGLRIRSIQTKLLLMMGGVALLVGVGTTWYSARSSRDLLREQVLRRGRYIVGNLAYNSGYGVLTEDKAYLGQLLDGAQSAGADRLDASGGGSDVVGVAIRDARGSVLSQKGAALKDTPSALPQALDVSDSVTESGEAVILFRAPVKTAAASSAGGGMAAELGLAAPAPQTQARDEIRGVAEVTISRARLQADQRAQLLRAALLAFILFTIGSAIGFVLTGRLIRPVHEIVAVASAVAQGDLTRTVDRASHDELGTLARGLSEMVLSLRKMVDNIQEASVQVASAAGQISANAKVVIQGAQGQAQAAEETSTSMEEMAASIQTVAGNAQSLASYVEETSSSITEMGASIEQVARSSGSLANTVAEASATVEEMTTSIDQMARSLESLAATVTQTSATVEEMTAFIASVSTNAESLSDAARRTSHTVSEMASGINQVAKIAQEADRISKKAFDDARSGDEAVGRTTQGIKTISETMENTARVITGLGKRSLEIGRILEVIEEIADQTNLLALNAAIEAARAGDAGRGFAVVADEVRKLAERSVEATKEIGEVIRQVQQETTDAVETARAGAAEAKEGIALADRAGLALRSITESVSRSSQLMDQIASATSTQSQASAEVLQTVGNMNTVSSQVTSAVRQQAEGSNQIRQAMENINRIMAQAAYSTKEQSAGGRQVRLAVENMNRIAAQVGIATKEQADGSRQIVDAVENMNRMTQQVSYATAEQKRGGELVVKAMENISEIARDNLGTVQEMSRAAANLAQQAESLAKLVAVFRVQ
jgi:methyl-accepting chemotaxis protein